MWASIYLGGQAPQTQSYVSGHNFACLYWDLIGMGPQYSQFVFLIVAIVITILNIKERYFTRRTTVSYVTRSLSDLDFPMYFSLSPEPGYNTTVLRRGSLRYGFFEMSKYLKKKQGLKTSSCEWLVFKWSLRSFVVIVFTVDVIDPPHHQQKSFILWKSFWPL